MDKVKFGVLSARSRGAFLAMLFNQHSNAEVVAIADPDETAFADGSDRRKKGSITNFRKYFSAEEMFKDEKGKIDWVIVASPDRTHYNMMVKALRAGYHVFAEKPMCQTIKEADDICRISEETGRHVVVGCELRYAEPVKRFRELLSKGAIGQILHGYCIDSIEPGFAFYLRDYRQKKWARILLLVKGIHSIDLINYFVGAEPVRVYADGGLDYFGQDPESIGKYCRDCEKKSTCSYSAYQVPSWDGNFFEKGDHARDHCVYDSTSDVEDNTIVIINYDNGARISYNEIYFAPDYRREYHFIGTDGRASLVLDQTARQGEGIDLQAPGQEVIITITKRNKAPQQIEVPIPTGGHWGGDLLMRDALINAALKGKTIAPNAHQARAALAIAYAAGESIEKGVPIKIPALF